MHVVYFETKEKIPHLQEGSILKYIAQEYRMNKQDHRHVFQVIGDPVTTDNAQLTHWIFPTEEAPTISHIKVI